MQHSLAPQNSRVLVLAKDVRHQGGYYDFVSMLLEQRSVDSGLEYFRVGRRVQDKSHLARILSIPYDHCRLSYRLASKDCDYLLFNTSMDKPAFVRDGLLMALAVSVFRKKVVVQVHGWQDAFFESIASKPLLGKLFRLSFARAACVIVLGQTFKQRLVGVGLDSDRVHSGTTMFDGGMFKDITAARDPGRIRILFLSRLIREKGAEELLRAFEIIRKQAPIAELAIAGEGPELEGLQGLSERLGLSEFVRFPGFVRGREKAALLLGSDIFVLPTAYGEGMPISILEAMAAGLPVVATRAGGVGELLANGDGGVLLDTNSPKDVADAILQLCRDRESAIRIGERNRELAWSEYEADVVTKKIVGLGASYATRSK